MNQTEKINEQNAIVAMLILIVVLSVSLPFTIIVAVLNFDMANPVNKSILIAVYNLYAWIGGIVSIGELTKNYGKANRH